MSACLEWHHDHYDQRQVTPRLREDLPERLRSRSGVWRRGPASSLALSREAEMRASLARPPPNLLFVVSPNLLNACAGCYILQANAHANGQPLWKHRGRAYWLLSTPMGRWAIAGKDVKDEGFIRAGGWIYQEGHHRGLMPDQCSSRWLLFDGKGAFTSDEAFKLTAPKRGKEGGFIEPAAAKGVTGSLRLTRTRPRMALVEMTRACDHSIGRRSVAKGRIQG